MENRTKASVAAYALFAAAVLYRIAFGLAGNHLGFFSNFSPLAAIALCGGIYLPRRVALGLPLAALLVSDLFLNWHFHVALLSLEMLSRYLALAASVAIGFSLRDRARLSTVLPASILGSLIFYVVTNTSSWLTWPGYARTFSGWSQALTTGLPGYAPTWMFFRSSLVSDLLFSALFVACMAITHSQAPEPSFSVDTGRMNG